MMRFGLSDLDELPSLKEFEQLAQAALGSDSGIAPAEPGEMGTAEVPESAEAAMIRASGENDDLAELAEDPGETPEHTRSAAAGGSDPS